MFAGYNTDVPHGGVVVHVQTEDRGDLSRYVESLVYVGGQIVATKRFSYAELLESGEDPSIVGRLMNHQHQAMIKAIRGGELDDELAGISEKKATNGEGAELESTEGEGFHLRADDLLEGDGGAAEVVVDPGPITLHYKAEPDLALGTESKLALVVVAEDGSPVGEVRIEVELITTISRPRTLAFGATDADGTMAAVLELPDLDDAFAAIIVSASTDTRQAELKLLL